MKQLKAPKSEPTRVECCGPHGPEHLIVSWITADKEQWVIFPKMSEFSPRRAFLGWCRRCVETYWVTR